MNRIASRMSSMALTLLGKAKHAGKGPCLPWLTTREPTALPLVHSDPAAEAYEPPPSMLVRIPPLDGLSPREACAYLPQAPTRVLIAHEHPSSPGTPRSTRSPSCSRPGMGSCVGRISYDAQDTDARNPRDTAR
jgi:hypothetical protein